MNWVFPGTLQYLQEPQLWAANARDNCDSWVFVRIDRRPYSMVQEIDPDLLIQEMTGDGGMEAFLFVQKENKSKQAHIGWIKTTHEYWDYLKVSRTLKLLFCKKEKPYLGNLLEPYPSTLV